MVTDRSAYIVYLETQLERTASACLTVQNFADRMNRMADQIVSVEERIVNLTRVIKLIQASDEAKQQENVPLNTATKDLSKTQLSHEILVPFFNSIDTTRGEDKEPKKRNERHKQ